MPVFVTRADGDLGRDLAAALRRDGADVRAFATGDGDVAALRAAGAHVAVGELDDEGHLDAAMTHAHTVVVPGELWLADPEAWLAEVATIVAAAGNAEVARVVLLSLVGADPDSDVPLLAAHGHAEVLVEAAGFQSLVVRTDGIAEPLLGDVLAAVTELDDEALAPVARDRLVEGLVALDAARSGRPGGHAVFTALGPVRSVAEWRRRLVADRAGPLVGRRWLPPARLTGFRAAVAGRGVPVAAGADLWGWMRGADS